MNDVEISHPPPILEALRADGERIGFVLASEPKTGALLRVLAACNRADASWSLALEPGLGRRGFSPAWMPMPD